MSLAIECVFLNKNIVSAALDTGVRRYDGEKKGRRFRHSGSRFVARVILNRVIVL